MMLLRLVLMIHLLLVLVLLVLVVGQLHFHASAPRGLLLLVV
jgi:hypothetical protein